MTAAQQLSGTLAASIAYLGNRGSKILAARQLNPAVYVPGATA